MGNFCCCWKDHKENLLSPINYDTDFIFNDPPTPRTIDHVPPPSYQYPTMAQVP